MICIEWQDCYNIGVDELDKHHLHLLDLFNQAFTACMLNNPLAELKSLVQELVEYTKYHFATEEQVMEESAYQGLDEQKIQHRYFNDRLADYILKIESNNVSSTIELVELTQFLATWFRDHIVNLDNKFGQSLHGSAV